MSSSDEKVFVYLSRYELEQLGTYNSEVYRGLIHTDAWKARMALLQARFDAEREQRGAFR